MEPKIKNAPSFKAGYASTKPILQKSTVKSRNACSISANRQALDSQSTRKKLKAPERKKLKALGKENCVNKKMSMNKGKQARNVSFDLVPQHDKPQNAVSKHSDGSLAARKQGAMIRKHRQPSRKRCADIVPSTSMCTSTQIHLPTAREPQEPANIQDVSLGIEKEMHATIFENSDAYIPYEPRSTFLKNIKLETRNKHSLLDPGNQRPSSAPSQVQDRYPWRSRLQNIPSQNFHNSCPETNSPGRTLVSNRGTEHASRRAIHPATAESSVRAPPLLGYDWIAGLIDNEANDKTRKSKAWFDDIKEFRRLNWFECHAHKSTDINGTVTPPLAFGHFAQRFPVDNSMVDMNSAANSDHGNFSHHCVNKNAAPHKCIHHFRINNRLFPEPVLQDDSGNSLCPICLTSRPKLKLESLDYSKQCSPSLDVRVTVPTALLQGSAKDDVMNRIGKNSQAVVRDGKQCRNPGTDGGNKIKSQSYELHSRLWRSHRIKGAWSPLVEKKEVPTTFINAVKDSLALRHQKFQSRNEDFKKYFPA